MKHLFTSLIFLIVSITLLAGTENPPKAAAEAIVKGKVVDKTTGEQLPFMTVLVKGTTIGTACDASGHFTLSNLPAGRQTIRIQGMGYKTVEKEVDIQTGKPLELYVELIEDAIMLDGAVVTANRNETDRREAPVIINVLSPQLFENTNSVCLAQGLNYQPGLRVENNCQNCGFQQVRINGLDGPYSQILIDSRPLSSSLAGVYGLEQIPANMIDRVEILRGGGSALFGSNAIAGTINIITREPLHNTFQASHNLSVVGGESYDNVTAFNGSIVNEARNAGIYLFGMIRNRQAYDHNGDGFTELGKITSSTAGFRSYFKPSPFTKLSLEYHHIDEFRRGGDQLDKPPHETMITEQTDHKINGGGLDFSWYSKDYKHRLNFYTSLQNIDRLSYYGAEKDPDAYGKTRDLTFVGGIQYVCNFDRLLFMPSVLTTGAEFSYNKLLDEMLGYGREINQQVRIYSAFLQNEWQNARFSFLVGVRFDQHNMVDNPIFSPRLNLRYNPFRDLSFRLSYSEGFRAPQTYDEDLHVGAVGGGVDLIYVADDLKTERSRSISGSVDYYREFGSVQVNLLVEGFYTHLKDIFVLADLGEDTNGNKIHERRNENGANVQGINVEGRIAPYRSLQFQFGATFQSSRYKDEYAWSDNNSTATTKKILRSPDRYGYLTASGNLFRNLTASLSGIYTGPMHIGHMAGYIAEDRLEKSSSFVDATLKLAYDIKISKGYSVQINAGLQNIFDSYQNDFDQGVNRDSKYVYGPGLPRTWFVGLKLGTF